MKKIFFFINIERGILFDNIERGILFDNIERGILFNNIEKDKRIELIKFIIFLSFFVSSDQ
jgi:hypothetical protein